MKKLITICAVVTMILAVGGVAQADWTAAATVRDESFYVASTGLTLGDVITIHSGEDYELSGHEITNDIQINLEYQAGILDEDIANINTYFYPADAAFPPGHDDGTWATNFADNEEYLFNIDLEGELTIYEYEGLTETVGGTDIKWTITGWHQTILAGDIVGNELVVVPTGTYRPFVGDPDVNNVEVFDGDLDTEVLGYTFTGAAGDIGSGTVLGVHLVPEPGTMVLLALGGIGTLIRRRRRRV